MKRRVIQAVARSWQTHLKWLTPGLGVKRWLLLLALGIGVFSLGGAVALRASYPLPPYFYYLTLQFIPRWLRATFFLAVGTLAIGAGIWGLNRALLAPFLRGLHKPIPEVLYEYHRHGRGPKIVVIGGGHGQAIALRGLKAFTSNLTAIVTVADDGGSSGRLRREIGILPPGDFRNCIAALADDEWLVTRLLQYRFAGNSDLQGHSFGNLFITAMTGITGSFESALKASSQVLAVQGQVLPSTLEKVTLCADVRKPDGLVTRICGESRIPALRGRILRVALRPDAPSAYPSVLQALLAADLIVIGPGSLYTSILPNLLVPQIVEALKASQAHKVFVCNVATQPGETDGYTAREHVDVVEQYLGQGVITAILVNERISSAPLGSLQGEWIKPDLVTHPRASVIQADLIDERLNGYHDSRKLAGALLGLLQ